MHERVYVIVHHHTGDDITLKPLVVNDHFTHGFAFRS